MEKLEEREQLKLIDRKFRSRVELVSVLASVYPQSAEREMRRYLNKYSFGLYKIIRKAQKDIASGEPKKRVLRRSKKQIEQLSLKYDPTSAIGKISSQIEGIEEAQFRKSFKKTIGVDMDKFDKDMFQEERDDWIVGTVGLIGLYLMSVNKQLDKAEEDDNVQESLQKIVDEHGGIREIARNRVGDFTASVNSKIYSTFGIKRYVWRTRRDHKVRDCHRSFDGHIFRVDQPPEIWYMTKHGRVYTGRHCHPGEDYNCRCRAIPLFTREAVLTILTREKWKKT